MLTTRFRRMRVARGHGQNKDITSVVNHAFLLFRTWRFRLDC